MMRRSNRSQQGFTLIEVMMAMSVMVVGALGIMAMQQASTRGNMNARQLTTGTEVTQLWLERVRRDAMGWNVPDSVVGVAGTQFLRNLPAAGTVDWFTPAGAALGETAAVDYFGNEVPLAQGRFCTHLRMVWLDPGRLARVDVRTWWHKRGDGTNDTNYADATLFPNCGSGTEAGVTAELETTPVPRLHAVYASTLVRWQRLPQ